MTLSVHHVVVDVVDPRSLAEAYVKGAGLRPVAVADGRGEWLAGPNAFVALRQARAAARGSDVYEQGIGHLCFQGEGRSHWDALTNAGVCFNAKPTPLGTGVLYAYGRDPDDNLLEVECVSDGSRAASPWIAHVALVTHDLDRLAAFYAALVGRPVHRAGRFRHPNFKAITGFDDVDVEAKWLMADNLGIELWRYHNPATVARPPKTEGEAGYAAVAFAAADLAVERARIEREGIVLREGADGLEGEDPDGNRVLVMPMPDASSPLSLEALSDPDIVPRRLAAS